MINCVMIVTAVDMCVHTDLSCVVAVTHSCIIALIQLYLPDGTEATNR